MGLKIDFKTYFPNRPKPKSETEVEWIGDYNKGYFSRYLCQSYQAWSTFNTGCVGPVSICCKCSS